MSCHCFGKRIVTGDQPFVLRSGGVIWYIDGSLSENEMKMASFSLAQCSTVYQYEKLVILSKTSTEGTVSYMILLMNLLN